MNHYFIMHNPLTFNLLHVKKNLETPVELLEFLSGRRASELNETNFTEYLKFDLSFKRKGLVEMMATDSTAANYIANQLARYSQGTRVILTDDRRRTIPGVIEAQGANPAAVFITSVSSNFPTAVATVIALNHAGIRVIIGGIHVSTSRDDVDTYIRPYVPYPELVSQVHGPGDGAVIQEILKDLENNTLKPQYQGYETIEDGVWGQDNIAYMEPLQFEFLDKIPVVGNSIKKRFQINSVTPYMGCPYSCNFCSISTLPREQRQLKTRSPEDFLAELQGYQEKGVNTKNRAFFFIPDNLMLGGKTLEKILDMIIASDLKINWAGQISIDVANNEKLLEKLRLAGASRLLIGMESLDIRNLEFVGKHILPDLKASGLPVRDYYARQVGRILDHGMSVVGAFIFGLPYDYFHSFEDNTAADVWRFCLENHISLQPSGLTDLPGSINFNESIRQGTYRHGVPGTMDYLLGLCITDLSEGNHLPPEGMKHSPLVVSYMIYESSQRVGSPYSARKNARYMAKKAWKCPTGKGRNSLKERFYDAFMGWGSQWLDSVFREAYRTEAYSRPGYKGTFERLYDAEQHPEIRKIFKDYVAQFKLPRAQKAGTANAYLSSIINHQS